MLGARSPGAPRRRARPATGLTRHQGFAPPK